MSRRLSHAAAQAASPLLAVAAALAVGAIVVVALGRNPWTVYALLARETFGSWYGIGQVLFKATPLLGTGLAVAVAFRAGLFNVGAEGQMILGGLACAVAALAVPAGCPPVLAVPWAITAAAAAGAAWATIPGFLRARFGVHEVIVTILLNFIATALAGFVLVTWLAQFETLHTAEIPPPARLARLEALWPALRGAPVNAALAFTLVACVVATLLLWHTRWGFEVRAAGASDRAARAAGVPVARRLVQAMAVSGALAGIAASNFVQGYKYYYEDGFSADAGFRGIAVALLARNHPLALVPAALLFGALDRGGFVLGRMVPKEFVDILQALVLLFVVVLTPLLRRWAARRAAGGR
jgi:simple sugar transport system permease protein